MNIETSILKVKSVKSPSKRTPSIKKGTQKKSKPAPVAKKDQKVKK
jgi:hypothetical protein